MRNALEKGLGKTIKTLFITGGLALGLGITYNFNDLYQGMSEIPLESTRFNKEVPLHHYIIPIALATLIVAPCIYSPKRED